MYISNLKGDRFCLRRGKSLFLVPDFFSGTACPSKGSREDSIFYIRLGLFSQAGHSFVFGANPGG